MYYLPTTLDVFKMVDKPLVLVDLDGVMLDNRHRLPHIVEDIDGVSVNKKPPDWATYVSLAHLDTAGHFVPLASTLPTCYLLVFLTARCDSKDGSVRASLLARLRELTGRFDFCLIMREPHNRICAVEFKRGAVKAIQERDIAIAYAVDDSHANCVMFAELGITTLRLYNHLSPTQYNY